MKNWVKRAARTFLQTAIGYIAVNMVTVDLTAERDAVRAAVIGLGVSAAAAGADSRGSRHSH